MRNPFRTPARRAQFDSAVRQFMTSGRVLFAWTHSGPVVPYARAGNSWSAAFWAGYDGLDRGARVPERTAIAFPWYQAGRECRPYAPGELEESVEEVR